MNELKNYYTSKSEIENIFKFLDVDFNKRETVFLFSFYNSKQKKVLEVINSKMKVKRVLFLDLEKTFCTIGIVTDLKYHDAKYKNELKNYDILHKIHISRQGIVNGLINGAHLKELRELTKNLKKNRFGKDIFIKKRFTQKIGVEKNIFIYYLSVGNENYIYYIDEEERYFFEENEKRKALQYDIFNTSTNDEEKKTKLENEKKEEIKKVLKNSLLFNIDI